MSATLSHSAAPNGLGTITPYLTCAGAAEAIAFYKKAFGASEAMRLGGPDGKIMHACLAIYGSHIFLSDEFPDFGNLSPKSLNGTPVSIHIFVDDADAPRSAPIGGDREDLLGRVGAEGRVLGRDEARVVRAHGADAVFGVSGDRGDDRRVENGLPAGVRAVRRGVARARVLPRSELPGPYRRAGVPCARR